MSIHLHIRFNFLIILANLIILEVCELSEKLKELYVKPSLEITHFPADDIIITSIPSGEDNEVGDKWGDGNGWM